ncbi:5-bromo-4-chloroindolyl phosphate hydrolysis family protein [Enterobacteriaceae bacterium BIT-l23]|uniref:5-bromo-4-chloroindolyl phosphate hydrolysis protein n=1 Tax=Jejubacter calystegiae TaxID=2579935 RepID=A0A4P8YG50_9ENTR|nr:5-bromo-4-chloroindolyl phosphate hydrolysis family protein [Jejubacter calystegiae]NUU65620.1 5-bromo-4-chloroindolyl phosphate hydrolysis family protein [Enterobacteriaceae bacterium BIT-l23]QCT18776.1 hypothetical protein FEM41_03495 [Jejubacter calystegiae]
MSSLEQRLAERLTDKRWKRATLVFLLFVLARGFMNNFQPLATELHPPLPEDEGSLDGAILVFCWAGFTILFRTLLFDRRALAMGIAAGLLWIPTGDILALPFWAGSMALLVYLLNSLGKWRGIHYWYMALWSFVIGSYIEAYTLLNSPFYTGAIIALFVTYCKYWYPRFIQERQAAQEEDEDDEEEAFDEDKEPDNSEDEPELAPFETEIARLESLENLEGAVHSELKGIIKYARLIQHCMLTDPRDMQPGQDFLNRYLPSVEEIITKSQNLSSQLAGHGNEHQVTARSVEILKALRSAFRQKHAQLLENDETELNTEVSTLEKLLKTDGFL